MRRLGQAAAADRATNRRGPFVPERHRRCRRCARPFIDGLVLVARGYITSGVCQNCLERAKTGAIDSSELFPADR